MKRIIMLTIVTVFIILSSTVVVYSASYQMKDEFGMLTDNTVETKDNYNYTVKDFYGNNVGSYSTEPERSSTSNDFNFNGNIYNSNPFSNYLEIK